MGLAIENAALRSHSEQVTIYLDDGVIQDISQSGGTHGAEESIDADGGLVTMSFANPHIHLDQIHTWPLHPNQSGTLEEAFRINREMKKNYTVEGIKERARPALENAAIQGNTLQRGFVDVDEYAGMTGIKALNDLKEECSDIVDIQTCIFAQEGLGWQKYESGEDYLWEAMDIGADVVGGIPWLEHTDEEVERHVDIIFDVATAHDAEVHFLVDDIGSPSSRALEYVALKTLEEGYEGRVACSHARSLAYYDDYLAERVIDLVQEANVHILTNTHEVLFLHPTRDIHPIERGLTRIKELQDAGVNVCIAQDDVSDMYYPFGQNDMLELGWFASHAARFSTPEEIDLVYDMISTDAAQSMGWDDHALVQGAPANLVVYDVPNVIEAFRTQAPRRYIIKDGAVVATTETESTVHRNPT